MTNPPDTPPEADFCARFKTQMMTYAPVYAGTREELSAYADEVAPTYYAMREDDADASPEDWADEDASCWEAE